MQLKNSTDNYGLVTRLLHWSSALLVIGLFLLGIWMTGLDYYHGWYKRGPDLHRSFGVILVLLTLIRVSWTLFSPRPAVIAETELQGKAAEIAHRLLLLLLIVIAVFGYLISTADGRGVMVFDLIEIPALPWSIENQEDLAGLFHEYFAYLLIGLVCLHALAALRHHFINRDQTLKRMLGLSH